ncbi:immune inhibitor A domain-containing protein [Flindersiella endophytica]
MNPRRTTTALAAAAAAVALAVASTQLPAVAAPPPAADAAPAARSNAPDDLPNPLGDKQRAMRKAAVEKVLRGEATVERRGKSDVVRVSKNQFAQVSMEQTDKIFTILTEFGTQTDPRTAGTPGPVRNQIPAPDRTRDNTTYWTSDFSRDHFMDLFFNRDSESFADFYSKLSNGQFSVAGDVSDWVKLPYNEARYGSNAIPSSDGYWNYVKDSATAWYNAQVAAGKTPQQIKDYLAQFDSWDRYDYDADGNFDEPDGYVDHFQAVHSGEGEEAGGGAQGGDAIWSHRWYAFSGAQTGPSYNQRGGVPLGTSGLWIGDYTTEPENGGLGVFAHEFGHDLGLPDLYDTNAGQNGTGFWTIMSSGSWLNHGTDTIGTTPDYMGAWEKLMLGWLDYEVVSPDEDSTTVLGTAAGGQGMPQALVVPLPKEEITTEYNTPFSGSYEWWGGSADNLNTALRRTINLTGKTSASLTTKAWYDIEEDFDFLYAEASADGGTTWERVGDPVTGSSNGAWADLTYDLSKYAGKQILFRFRYTTDGGVHLAGPMLDNVAIVADGQTIFTDDVEAVRGWTAVGWSRMSGSVTDYKGTYYLAESRQYVGYDATLKTGPYSFNRPISKPDWVQRIPYQNGLLIWYWNEKVEDNDNSLHPGEGLILPIDSSSKALRYDNGQLVSNRLQPFDATFGVEKTDSITLSNEVRKGNRVQVIMANVPSRAGVREFNDTNPNAYWDASNPQNSVKVGGYGVKIGVVEQSAKAAELTVQVQPAG